MTAGEQKRFLPTGDIGSLSDPTDTRYEELCEWRDLWMSRMMFGFLIGPEFTERRSFNDFLLENAPHLARGVPS